MLVTKTIGVDPRLAEDAFYEEDYLRGRRAVNAAFVERRRSIRPFESCDDACGRVTSRRSF